ncbi:hypothetical protein CAPTEDRAFT_226825 [Capitella teleta]|uniref:SSD domain-containing protein n=1 Tax=Capitella teleta TaxID=283909 RepID=R7VF73_CAPTE|nr:hypothetical protein CAPTEDRAFT_226825 [Capitella teleta]|eukprot:ELU17207.1 hypothetical protein CAPTEDRAFT_226825 [Capitella teleta]
MAHGLQFRGRPSPNHMDGYPRYDAGDRGQSNPAFDGFDDDLLLTQDNNKTTTTTTTTTTTDKNQTSKEDKNKSKSFNNKTKETKSTTESNHSDKNHCKDSNTKTTKTERQVVSTVDKDVEKNEREKDAREEKYDEDKYENEKYSDEKNPQSKGDKEAELIGYCVLVTKHPKSAFCIALAVHLLLALLMLILLLAGFDILPANFSDIPLSLVDDEQFLRAEAWRHRESNVLIHPYLASGGDIDQQSVKMSQIQVAYEAGSNIFTTERLKAIQKAEDDLMGLSGMTDYCLMQGSTCAKPVSILRFFDGSYSNIDRRLDDPDFQDIAGTLMAASENSVTNSILDFHLGRDFVLKTGEVSSTITRSLIYLAGPLAGYDNFEINGNLQIDLLKKFEMGNLRDKLYDLRSSGVGNMDFTFISSTLYIEDVVDQVVLDLSLAFGSFLFIFLFMWFQTRSLFVTAFALLSILTSFCGANLLYRLIFGYKYFGIFHVLSIFIILGIGADDIFVFFDTWSYSSLENYKSLEMRFSASYRRAALAMLVTSITTMLAFFVSAFCDLLAVASFGLFSGLLVFVNYISSITYFPTVVMLYHVKWENKPLCPCMDKGRVDSEKGGGAKESSNPVVRFFAGPYFKFITHKIIRWVIIAAYAILLIVFIYFATTLVPDEEGVKLWKDSTNYGKAKSQQANSFKPSMEDEVIQVYMIWGLKKQDRSACSKYKMDILCSGKTVWNNGFDMNPSHAQYALLNFCDELRNLDDEMVDKLKVRRDSATGELQVKCYLENMEAFYETELQKSKYHTSEAFKLPTSKEKIVPLMEGHPAFYDMSKITDRFHRYFEVALSYWLSNGYSGSLTYDYEAFGNMVGESNDILDSRPLGKDTGYGMPTTQNISKVLTTEFSDYYYGNRLRYMAVAVNTTLPFGNLSQMPPSLSEGFQCTPEDPTDSTLTNSWHWFKVQDALAWNAMTGILTGICLACPILILATMNAILGLLATFIICAITVTVVGFIPMGGWKLGVLESLNLALVVGLAVDYVVHLAEGYSRSQARDRKGRVKEMLERIGVSVVSGAATTLGASFFMLFAKILFFMQFGIFMFCTIGFSLLYALGLFATLLAIIGPEGDTGSIRPLLAMVKRWLTGRKKSDVDCRSLASILLSLEKTVAVYLRDKSREGGDYARIDKFEWMWSQITDETKSSSVIWLHIHENIINPCIIIDFQVI